jgi:DNA-binding transcriptional LysR family regulator
VNERQLEYVVAIAETGSFTAAAERCYTAQSGLSQQIARLEGHLGVRLFDRTSRSVRLTEAGQTLLPLARQILADMNRAREAVRSVGVVVRGPLRIGATQTAARILNLIQLLADYNRKYSDVDLSVTIGPGTELISAIGAADLDVAFAAADSQGLPAGVEFTAFSSTQPLIAVVSPDHQLASRHRVRLQELAATSRFVDFRPHTALWNKTEAMCTAAGVHRDVMCELGHIGEMVRLAASGLAAAIVPAVFTEPADDQPRPEDIRVLELAEPGAFLTIGTFLRRDRLSAPAIRAFTALLSEDRHAIAVGPSIGNPDRRHR